MPTQDIFNYRKVNEQLSTAGQPTEAQLRSAAGEGFKVVINLATETPKRSLNDEAGLVQSLNMTYHHIPVEWENPIESDFDAFETVMHQLADQKTLIHCMANFRVTAFYGLYAMKHLGWTEEQVDAFRAEIWQGSDHPIWEAFVREMKEKIGTSR